MKPWVLLDTTDVPGGGTLRLFQRDTEFSIRLSDGSELMNSRLHGSEEALARLGIGPIAARPAARVLVGGLGMGFTLRAALALLGADAAVTVAELVPAVIGWGQGPMAGLFAGCLDDARVQIAPGDVAEPIRVARSAFDAILLDVDNGPDGLTHAANDGLYGFEGLRAAGRALKLGGRLAVWSAAPDRAFAQRLRDCGFALEEHRVRAQGGKGARHIVWVGVRTG